LPAPDKVAQEISAVSVDLSSAAMMLSERTDRWSSNVDAADAKKAETEAIGGAGSQSPVCGDDAAKSLALSVASDLLVRMAVI